MEDVRISDNVYIRDVRTGDNTGNHIAIDSGFYCTTKLIIGNYVHIAANVTVIGSVKSTLILDDYSAISAGSVIVCASENYVSGGLINPTIPEKYRDVTYGIVTFGKYTCAGANCTILPNVTISEGSVIGAGAVVTKTTEPWGVYSGVPAKIVKFRNKELTLQNVRLFEEETFK